MFRFPWLDIMLEDAAHIQEKDSEWENRRRAGDKLIAPLYSVQDADDVLTRGEPLAFGQKARITRDAEQSAIRRH